MNAREFVKPVAEGILSTASQVEAERRLPDALMARLKEAGMFSIYTPARFGGMELPFPSALEVVEEVARLDGSTGWTVALGIANGYLTSNLTDETAALVLAGGSALISGAPAPMARAQRVPGGYRLTGQWSYNSGCTNADWNTVAAPVFDGDQPCLTPAGPEMVELFLHPGAAELIDNWHVSGLRGTGSYDLRADDVFVPAEFAGGFSMPAGPRALRESAISRIPFMTALVIAQSPPVALGIARSAIDEFKALARAKMDPMGGPALCEQVQAHGGLARAEALLAAARAYFFSEVGQIWVSAVEARQISLEQRTRTRLACLTAVENATAAVDLVYRLAGSSALFLSSPLERCWRDVHAAAQHFQVQEGRWETAGRVLFGLEPNSPII
jgi:alkylation response protein AidB-like acyl-CoA dehydrogenase